MPDYSSFFRKYIHLIAIMVSLLSVYAIVNFLSDKYPNQVADFLMYLLPLSLLVSFSAIIALSILNRRMLAERFRKVGKNTWITLLVILLLGFLIRAVTPQTHRIYFDEDIFENIAQNMLSSGRAILCNTGTPSSCDEYILNKQPNSYSFLLAVAYAAFGVGEAPAFWLNIFIGGITPFFVFLLAYMIFRNEKIALYSSLVFALTPMHIIWSATAATEPLMALSIVLAAAAFIFYLEKRKLSLLLLFSALFVFTMQTRHEAILLAVPLSALFLMNGNAMRNFELHGKDYLIAVLFMLLLSIPHFLHLSYANRDSWGSSGEKLSTQYFGYSLSTNTAFFYENTRYPAFFTAVALAGFLYCAVSDRKLFAFMFLWLAAFFSIYLFFYAGSYNAGVDAKYSISVAAQMSMFAGAGFFFLEGKIRKLRRNIPASHILAAAILAAFYFFIPYVTNIWEESFEAREYHDFALRTADKINNSCYILSHVPSMYIVSGKNSAQNWNINLPDKLGKILEKTGCIVYDEGYWCQLEPYKSDVCGSFHRKYNLTLIGSYAPRKSAHVYSLYYVDVTSQAIKPA